MPEMTFDLGDRGWTDDDWQSLMKELLARRIVTWKEVASLTLGHLNPPQVGTSLASSDGFKRKYGKGNTMSVVVDWFYKQSGKCADCMTRLELQADHSTPRESFEDPLDADHIDNMVLRCRRCNVIKRPSHEFGGRTHLTAEAGLMWILFVLRPRTREDFTRLCRVYGMTMSDIRMNEGWAMAEWLSRTDAYQIDKGARPSQLIRWGSSGAVTRKWTDDLVEGEFDVLQESVASSEDVLFVVADRSETEANIIAYRIPVLELPFSHYFRGTALTGDSLAIDYVPPKRDGGEGDAPKLVDLAPRGRTLLAWKSVSPEDSAEVSMKRGEVNSTRSIPPRSRRKKLWSLSHKLLDEFRIEISGRPAAD